MSLVSNERGTIFTETIGFMIEQCCSCGVLFAMSLSTERQRRADGKFFYCPNGHPQHYIDTTEQRLQKQLMQERQKLDQAKADAEYQRNQRHATERRLAAAKGQITKVKKRVGNGVCPCCNRFIKKLADHMKTKHPEYAKAEAS